MAIDDVIDALNLLRPIAKALPLLEGGIEAVIHICEFAAVVKTNKADSQDLANRAVEDIKSVCHAMQKAEEVARKQLTEELHDVLRVLDEIRDSFGHRVSSHGFRAQLRAVREKNKTADELRALKTKLWLAVERFQSASQIRQEIALNAMTAAQSRQEITVHQTTTLQLLAPVYQGYLDIGDTRSGCLENTHVHVLERLSNWIDLTDDRELVFWLVGLAGTGKSTIATTISGQFDVHNKAHTRTHLAAWFFCSGQYVVRRQAANIFLTLVYQLALLDHGLRMEICTALRKQPDLPSQQLSDQILSLLQEPLQNVDVSVILMIDALDECEQDGGKLLPLLATTAKALQGKLRLLITSRPERRIEQMFQQLGPNSYALHDVGNGVGVVQADILHYFQYHFGQIREQHSMYDINWPSDEQLTTLVNRSGNLFAYAAAVVKFIAQPLYDPQELLKNILTQQVVDPAQGSPYKDVDLLYTQVLQAAIPDHHGKTQSDALAAHISKTVGTVIFLQTPLSSNALVMLLNSKDMHVKQDLHRLSAILHIPTNPALPVEIFHPSFPDFLVDARRCTDSRFLIKEQEMHSEIALCCLQLMNKELHFNMTGQVTLPYSNNTVSAEEVQDSFSEALQYACKYWMHHISLSSKNHRTLVSKLEEFGEQRILNWVEAASLLSALPLILTTLPQVEQWASSIPECTIGATILHDTLRICQSFYTAISTYCMDIYHSAMAFGPDIPVTRFIGQLPPGWPHVQLQSGKNSYWDPLLQVINAGSSVYSATFSSDGRYIVSGSRDKTVRIWNAITGAPVSVMEGHTGAVRSCNFSPDGKYIASGSDDETMRIWDAITGAQVLVMEGHTGAVRSCNFSPDGKYIVSGSDDKTMRIWDAVTGAQVSVMKGHTGAVRSCNFSPDHKHNVSGSDDKSMRIWDAATGAQVSVLTGHTLRVISCSFSPDGKHIVSGSSDETIRIWDVTSGGQLTSLEGHTDHVRSCNFSLDGKHIVSGSDDKTVRLWDTVTKGPVSVLQGHTDCVNSCSFSPDSKCIVSGSDDGTVRIWEAAMVDYIPVLPGHTNWVTSCSVSPDFRHIVSGSNDGTLRVWDAATGAQLLILQGHKSCVRSCNFSPDGKHIVSGSDDQTVRIWNAFNGGQVLVLEGHTDDVNSCSFSPDGKQIVSASFDRTVRIWNVATGGKVFVLEGHTYPVISCSFSPKGNHIVSGSGDMTLRLWDTATGAQVSVLHGHTDLVRSCTFSSDGNNIISGSDDNTVRIWDATNYICVAVYSCSSASFQYLPDTSILLLLSSQIETPPQLEITHYIPGLSMQTIWLDKKGFLYVNSQLICWITPDRLPVFAQAMCLLSYGTKTMIALGSRSGLLTILDITKAMSL